MLLDEIDEMTQTAQKLAFSMDQIYSVYIPYYPDTASLILDLKEELTQLQNARHDQMLQADIALTQAEKEARAAAYEHMSESKALMATGFSVEEDIKAHTTMIDDMGEEIDVEQNDKQCKLLFRKISNATHPDKVMRYSSEIRLRLRDLFIESKEIYKNRNQDVLIAMYIRVMLVRGEQHKLDPKILEGLQRQHQVLVNHLNALAAHSLYAVLTFHHRKQIDNAKQVFSKFLLDQVSNLETQIFNKRAELNGA